MQANGRDPARVDPGLGRAVRRTCLFNRSGDSSLPAPAVASRQLRLSFMRHGRRPTQWIPRLGPSMTGQDAANPALVARRRMHQQRSRHDWQRDICPWPPGHPAPRLLAEALLLLAREERFGGVNVSPFRESACVFSTAQGGAREGILSLARARYRSWKRPHDEACHGSILLRAPAVAP